MDKQDKNRSSLSPEAEIERDPSHGLSRLMAVVARLRKECPWDRRQTPRSLLKGVLEEAYEVIEAVESDDWQGLKEELGDLLLQILLQTELQRETGSFELSGVIEDLTNKMIRRHPHVFAGKTLENDLAVSRHWERIKSEEKGGTESLFDEWTRGLPALLDSYKIGRKAGSAGFDWPEPLQVLDKIEEEIEEIREAVADGERAPLQEELGDLLFAVSNLVRKFGFEPEATLRAANRKFVGRFRVMEQLAREMGRELEHFDLQEQEALWQRAKQQSSPIAGDD